MNKVEMVFRNGSYDHLIVFHATSHIKFDATKLMWWLRDTLGVNAEIKYVTDLCKDILWRYKFTVPSGCLPDEILEKISKLEAQIEEAVRMEELLEMVMK